MAKASTQTNRSEARDTATGAGQTTGTGRRPKPEDNTTNQGGGGEQGQTGPEAPQMNPELHSLINIAGNPKRAGTIAFKHYGYYPPKGQLSDIFAARKAGVRGKDLSWDRDPARRHILVGKDALAFNEICQGDPEGNRDACAKFLKDFGVAEASLIKWGYMDKPVEAAKTEGQEPAKADA